MGKGKWKDEPFGVRSQEKTSKMHGEEFVYRCGGKELERVKPRHGVRKYYRVVNGA